MGREDITDNRQRKFIHCAHCKGPLVEILPSGAWYFRFGKKSEANPEPMVEMQIHGTVKMKCWRRTCGKTTVLNFFGNQPIGDSQNFKEE